MKPTSIRTRQNDPEGLRARVLDAAADLFEVRGYHATSMKDLMQATGVSGGALHHHFPTKKSLALAVIADRVAPAVSTNVDRSDSSSAVARQRDYRRVCRDCECGGCTGVVLRAVRSTTWLSNWFCPTPIFAAPSMRYLSNGSRCWSNASPGLEGVLDSIGQSGQTPPHLSSRSTRGP